MAALLRGILNPRARWEKMYSEGRDLGDKLASREKDAAQWHSTRSLGKHNYNKRFR